MQESMPINEYLDRQIYEYYQSEGEEVKERVNEIWQWIEGVFRTANAEAYSKYNGFWLEVIFSCVGTIYYKTSWSRDQHVIDDDDLSSKWFDIFWNYEDCIRDKATNYGFNTSITDGRISFSYKRIRPNL